MRKLAALLAVLSLGSAVASAQRHEAHAGAGLPMYTVFGVPLADDAKSIGPSMNVGCKLLKPIGKGWEWYYGADIYERNIHFDGKWYVGQNKYKDNVAALFNLPVGAGLRYTTPSIGGRFALFADMGAGLNLNIGKSRTRDGHGLDYNIWDGGPFDSNYDVVTLTKTLKCYNLSAGFMDMLGWEQPSCQTLFFTVDFGTIFDDRWVLGFNYANFGVIEVYRTRELYYRTNAGMDTEVGMVSNRCMATLVLSSLSLRVGYIF